MNRRRFSSALAMGSLLMHPDQPPAQARWPTIRSAPMSPPKEHAMQLRISWGPEVLLVELDPNRSAEDLASMLPLTLSLEDYAGTEKIAYLPRRLDTRDAPDGYTPHAGDLAYYAPWGNLALFYRDFRHSPGLVRIGRLSSPLDALRFKATVEARVERVPT